MGHYRFYHSLPEFLLAVLAVWIHFRFRRWLREYEVVQRSRRLQLAVDAAAILLAFWVAFGFLSNIPFAYVRLPASWAVFWIRGTALAWAAVCICVFVILSAWRRVPHFSTARRGFLRATGGLMVAAPFAAMGVGVITRHNVKVREVDIPIPNLPKDLQGLRLVQLSDIHLSPFMTEKELSRTVDMANGLNANIALVTGDLITSRGDPLDACLRQLARLRSDAGIYGCLGNHEIYAHAERAATVRGARLGIQFLRQQRRPLRFGNATLNIAGVDYQRKGWEYLAGAEKLIQHGAVNVLLSHNPDVFDVAVDKGFDLTISGHTHGGQVNVEILNENINVARFFTPYVYGLYTQDKAAAWVTRGIGTVGIPARIGAPPEIALLRLCAI